MLYRTLQKRLRALKSTIALNQKKSILLNELESLLATKNVPAVEFREIRDPCEITVFMSTVDKSLCNQLGSRTYWEGLLKWPVDLIIHAVHLNKTVGFVLVRNNYVCSSTGGCLTDMTRNTFYLELICGKGGVGSQLIDYVKRLAQQERKSYIHLSALFDVISYYASKHQFIISTGCYPRMETEIEQLLDLHRRTQSITRRRMELTTLMKAKPLKLERATITSERRQLTLQMQALAVPKNELLEKLKTSSTYQLKHPGQKTSLADVLDEGIFMSFCLSANV